METVRMDVPLDQIKKVLRQLPSHEKIALWRLLDEDLDRPAIARRFASSVVSIRKGAVSPNFGSLPLPFPFHLLFVKSNPA